ncbi:hypothetical protein HU200_020146 [Digitaria exilis]|uniref:DUF4220 domain-containing protein n=1 Tax=Digitaria exilis TaxID=1010633 RepID=A0A835F1N0_9POAL|nr:hypothetical protein HU200_020146 [Digitaria exilis]
MGERGDETERVASSVHLHRGSRRAPWERGRTGKGERPGRGREKTAVDEFVGSGLVRAHAPEDAPSGLDALSRAGALRRGDVADRQGTSRRGKRGEARKRDLLFKNSDSLCALALSMNVGRIFASKIAGSFTDDRSLYLAEYMKHEHSTYTTYDPVTMIGYNYLISWNINSANQIFTGQLAIGEITLSEICGRRSNSERLKDLCLSFALFQLLRRRLFGVPCPESNLQKTHDLIFQGLLLNVEDDDYKRAYRVIEAELAFAHDHMFTSSASFSTELRKPIIILSGLKASCYCESIRHSFSDHRNVTAIFMENHASTMLMWHIATEYCEISYRVRTRTEGTSTDQGGIVSYTTVCFQKARKDAMEFLREERSLESKYRKMNQPLSASAASDEGTAFTMGLQLGKQLEEIECAGRWKVLADLWTEMILYSAPSSNARDHIQHLANGGEFLTHLWALLSHAGILAREEQGFDKENTPL